MTSLNFIQLDSQTAHSLLPQISTFLCLAKERIVPAIGAQEDHFLWLFLEFNGCTERLQAVLTNGAGLNSRLYRYDGAFFNLGKQPK